MNCVLLPISSEHRFVLETAGKALKKPKGSGRSTTEARSGIQRLMKVSNMGTVKPISPHRAE
jgi:hypothetical protein